jgi:hypothetical protein
MDLKKKEEQILSEIEMYLNEGYDRKTILSVLRAKYNDSKYYLNDLIDTKMTQIVKKALIKDNGLSSKKPETNDNNNLNHNQDVDKPIHKKNSKLKIIIWIFTIIAVFLMLFIYFSNDYRKGENLENLEREVPLFTQLANNAVYNIELGSSKIKEGFQEYLDSSRNKPDINVALAAYIYSAELFWGVAEEDMSVMLGIMKKTKEIIKPSAYEKFANLYSSIAEYKQGVSPYGKNSSNYNKYSIESKIKMTREMTIFSTFIGNYEDLLK